MGRCDGPTGGNFKGHTDVVAGVCFSPDGTRLASASWDGTVKVWDAAMTQESLTLNKGDKTGVYGLCFSPDGTRLASIGRGQMTVKVWDTVLGREKFTLEMDANPHGALWFSPDGLCLTVGNKVWDMATGQAIPTLNKHPFAKGHGICYSPDGKRWRRHPRWERRESVGHGDGHGEALPPGGFPAGLTSLCFSPDGKRLAGVASPDVPVTVWDATTGEKFLSIAGDDLGIFDLCFSPDGKRLAGSNGSGQKVRVWDTATGREVLTLKGHTGGVGGVCFSPDGTRLASASGDGTVKLWDSSNGTRSPDP